jgi:hypothetical protein
MRQPGCCDCGDESHVVREARVGEYFEPADAYVIHTRVECLARDHICDLWLVTLKDAADEDGWPMHPRERGK